MISEVLAARQLGCSTKFIRENLSHLRSDDGKYDPAAVMDYMAERRRGHGTECPIWLDPLRTKKKSQRCRCLVCHCEPPVPGMIGGKECATCFRLIL